MKSPKLKHCTLGALVGFWIESVPRLKNPTEEEIKLHMKRCNGDFPSDMPVAIRAMEQGSALMVGLMDHRENRAHTYRQTLQIWTTRAQAQRAAKAMDNEWWTHRVRMARKANSAIYVKGAK